MTTALVLSHHTAPVSVRERFSIDDDAHRELRLALVRAAGSAVVLATCNRLELYTSRPDAGPVLVEALRRAVGVDEPIVRRHFRSMAGKDAVRHLFKVASGVDSLVLGESEILGQVRTAFSEAVADGSTDALLNHLFHSAIRMGRLARRETAIGLHPVSVSALAARAAREALGSLEGRTALLIGAGEAARLAAGALRDLGAGRILVANRTASRAEVLAEAIGGEAIPFQVIADFLPLADVVLTATGAGSPLIDCAAAARALMLREGGPVVYIDIGVPRDIDPAVASVTGVRYVDLDALEDVAAENQARRRAEVSAVEALVDREVGAFATWLSRREVLPVVRSLTFWADSLRTNQIDRAHRGFDLTPGERERFAPVLEAFSRSLVQQVLHPVLAALRDEDGGAARTEAVRELFGLATPAPE